MNSCRLLVYVTILLFIMGDTTLLSAFDDNHCFTMGSVITYTKKGDYKSVLKALKEGYNPKDDEKCLEIYETPYRTMPVMEAAFYGHIDILKLLIKYGANINAVAKINAAGTVNGNTLLTYAAYGFGGHIEIVRFLVDSGIDINRSNDMGRTALMFASDNGDKEIVSYLLDHGADVNLTDIYGWSALMYAINNMHVEIVELLLRKGANVHTRNKEGKTPLKLAKNLCNAEKLGPDYLRYYCPNPDHPEYSERIVSLLIKFGAQD